MTAPSVKGAMLVMSVVQIRRARDEGRIPESRLSRLSPETRGLLDERIQLSRWYPMKPFVELLELDWEFFGNRAPDYMRRAGELSAAAFARTQRYQQLEYLKRTDRPKTSAELVRQVRLTSSVTLSYYNFVEVSARIHPERPNVLQVVYSNTDAYPEALRYSVEGYMNYLNRMRGSERKWTSERIGHQIVFSLEMKERPAGEGG